MQDQAVVHRHRSLSDAPDDHPAPDGAGAGPRRGTSTPRGGSRPSPPGCSPCRSCVLFLVFTLGPVLASLGMSFTDMQRTDMRNPFAVRVRRAGQLHQAGRGPAVPQGHPQHAALPRARRPADHGRRPRRGGRAQPDAARLKGFFRVGYYLPVVTSIVAVSVVWKFLYRDNGGLLQHRARLGRHRRPRTGSTAPRWPCRRWSLMAVWRNFGTLMVIFLAGLQTIPRRSRGRRGRRRHRRGGGSATSPCRCCGRPCCSAR